jgi:SAM-dependent methyltransferase
MRVERVPLFCSRLCESREEAAAMPRASIFLVLCNGCGHVFNQEFDPERLEYGPGYENSLHCSGEFQTYARALARSLVEQYDLCGQDIVEIGCGRGEFLRLLCENGGNRGVGFDPSYCGLEEVTVGGAKIVIRREKYDGQAKAAPADFVCSRHTLEHIADPRRFLADIREAIARPNVPVFFEVPNALYSLTEGMWDVIYEHCSYYSLGSLGRLFAEEGFAVTELSEGFRGQFATVHARTSIEAMSGLEQANVRIRELANSFAELYRSTVDEWRKRFVRYERLGKRVVVWGAGAKGTTFLNTINPRVVNYVVDINPLKQDKYVAGTGQLIISPERLPELEPDVVIIQNRNYGDEIARKLRELKISPEIVPV